MLLAYPFLWTMITISCPETHQVLMSVSFALFMIRFDYLHVPDQILALRDREGRHEREPQFRHGMGGVARAMLGSDSAAVMDGRSIANNPVRTMRHGTRSAARVDQVVIRARQVRTAE